MDNRSELIIAVVFSVIMTFVMFFVLLVLPFLFHTLLLRFIPDNWPDPWDTTLLVNQLRLISYFFVCLMLILFVLGLIIKRYKISISSPFFMCLPTFTIYSHSMFIFAGIGVLMFLWVPLTDFSPDLIRLGDVVSLPSYFIVAAHPMIEQIIGEGHTWHSDLLRFGIIILGITIFVFGTITWFYGHIQGIPVTNFWIYKYSRHPQYLGILIWTYGQFIVLPILSNMADFPIPSLFWVIAALTTIGLALSEESELLQNKGEEYAQWYAITPFMFPLPIIVSNLLSIPGRVFLNKERLETKLDIFIVLVFYGLILILLSLPVIFIIPTGFYYDYI